MHFLNDTIAALATPPGKGAVAMIRLSGDKSIDIGNRVFVGKKSLKEIPSARMTYGRVIEPESGDVIDKVLVVKFKNPHSFTGEDVVEISCHGGPFIVQQILNVLLENGARLAEPGEFTKRAFLNGKMDLLQAESVADIIDSRTRSGLRQSQSQLFGKLSQELLHFKKELQRQLTLLEIELDFSEEDIEFASRDELSKNINSLIKHVDELLDSFKYGKVLREGVQLALVGRPNVGKSSILNRLLREDRAIVSETPGTTRDVIEEALDIDGLLFKISDTAGIRLAKDDLEAQGVERTKRMLSGADVVLFIVESGHEFTDEDFEALEIVKTSVNEALLFLLINKIDLGANRISGDALDEFDRICELSAKTGEGFSIFKKQLVDLVFENDVSKDSVHINKARHRDALRRTREALLHAEDSIKQGLSPEYISLDVRTALDALGEITGEVTTEDILSDIFSSFCIGK